MKADAPCAPLHSASALATPRSVSESPSCLLSYYPEVIPILPHPEQPVKHAFVLRALPVARSLRCSAGSLARPPTPRYPTTAFFFVKPFPCTSCGSTPGCSCVIPSPHAASHHTTHPSPVNGQFQRHRLSRPDLLRRSLVRDPSSRSRTGPRRPPSKRPHEGPQTGVRRGPG